MKRSDTAALRDSLKTLQKRLDVLMRDAKAIRDGVDELAKRDRLWHLRQLLKRHAKRLRVVR